MGEEKRKDAIISVCLGTLNRLNYLRDCINSIRNCASGICVEIIVVDGGSHDGTVEWLKGQGDITPIFQGVQLGAVKAFNAGFREAHAPFICNLNDDATLVGDIFQSALEQFRDKTIGQIAIPFKRPGEEPHFDFVPAGIPRKPWRYANFGITRKHLGDYVGWWGDKFVHYAGDSQLSMMLWNLGYQVVDLKGDGYVLHYEAQDETRKPNFDSPVFFAQWKNWSCPPLEPVI